MGRAVERASVGLALAGGALVLALALLVTTSVARRWLTSEAVPGDFELVQAGLAVAVFAFLPLCQLRGGNIVVDSFTGRVPPRVRAALDGFWALVYAAAAGLIAWQLAKGAAETVASGTTSMVLGLPVGWAIWACTACAAWLALTALAGAAGIARKVPPA